MAYMNDPRENRFGPDGEIWENDNRVEKRYCWNGAFIDLCDLPPTEYVKTIFHTDGSSSGGGGGEVTPSGKVKNLIQIEVNPGEVVYNFRAVAQQKVKESITITALTTNGKEISLIIPAGQMVSNVVDDETLIAHDAPGIAKADHNPKEDEQFIYNVNPPIQPDKGYDAIYTVVPENEVQSGKLEPHFITEGNKEFIDSIKGGEFNVIIPRLPEGTPEDPDKPVNFSVIISIPTETFNTKEYEIRENVVNPVTEFFLPLDGTYSLDGISYTALYRVCDDGQYSSRAGEDLEYTYKIIKK